jgi:PleD family two-component response regulator
MERRLDSDFVRLGRPARVLVADDDPVNRELIEEICRSEGFEVEGVDTGDRALATAQTGAFDLLLLDVTMPGTGGLEVCRALKSDPRTAAVPVMIVSASTEDAVRDRATELGAAAFISKPFRIFELSQRMRAALRIASREGEPPTAPHIRLRRKRADALSSLPSPSALRARLQREIDVCLRDEKAVVCAVLRLEDEGKLSATIGRSSTDALLGGAVIELSDTLEDGLVRADVDEIIVLLPESELPSLAAITSRAVSTAHHEAGVSVELEICIRWGAAIVDPHQTDPDLLVAAARAAVEKARHAGEPGAIERSAESK